MNEVKPQASAEHPGREPTRFSRLGQALDRLVFAISPERGARRMSVRKLWAAAEARQARLTAHEGAQNDRIRADRWLTSKLSPDSILEEDLETLRDRSRDLNRSDAIGGATDSLVNHVVGRGLRAQPRIAETEDGELTKKQAKRLNRQLKDLYRRWYRRADRSGTMSLWQIQRLVERSVAVDGECFVVLSDLGHADKPLPLALEVVASERVETPPEQAGNPLVRLGIEKDADGRIVAYYIRISHPGDTRDVSFQYERVPADRVLHRLERWYPGQSRGLPWLTRVLNRAKDAKDVDEATIIATQIEACYTAFVEAPEGQYRAALGAASGDTSASGKRIQDLEPGTVHYMAPGQKVNFGSPSRPGATFDPFMQWNYRRVAAGINFPFELLLKDWRGLSFAGGRLALTDGRLDFGCRQQLLDEQVLCPVWYRLVDEAVILDELDVDPRLYAARPWIYQAHVWIPPAWPYALNPGEEVKADSEAVGQHFRSLSDIVAGHGYDLEELLEQRAHEEELLGDFKLQRVPMPGEAPTAKAAAEDPETVEAGR